MRRVMCFSLTVGVLPCANVEAQPAPAWEIELHGGGMRSTMPDNGTFALPAAASTTTSSGSRQVSSWFFGDGSSQVNQYQLSQRRSPIAPLDGEIQRRILERQSGGAAGFRVSRRITSRLWAEFALDYGLGELALTEDLTAALEASRASFVSAFSGLFTPGGFLVSRTADATATLPYRSGRQVITTGAVRFDVLPAARLVPYVVGGVGGVAVGDSSLDATLRGSYSFTTGPGTTGLPLPTYTIGQTDTLTLRSALESGAVWVLGGGLRFGATRRLSVRVDVRDHMRSNTVVTRIEASPTLQFSTPSANLIAAALSFPLANPPLVFSSSNSSSTLGTALPSFTTFTGTGTEHHLSVTTGLAWRF